MKLLRIGEVIRRTGLSKATIYAWIKDDLFPRPIRVGKRAVRWIEKELVAWIKSRPRTVPA